MYYCSLMNYRKKWLLTVGSMYNCTCNLLHVHVHDIDYYRNYEDILLQASTWEDGGEYSRAIETLLQLTVNNCDNQQVLINTWTKVGVVKRHTHKPIMYFLL